MPTSSDTKYMFIFLFLMTCVLGGQFNLHKGLAGTTSLGCFLRAIKV